MSALVITIAENLRLKNVPDPLRRVLMEKLQFVNPKWIENERMRRWNRGTPKILRFYDKDGPDGLWIPRGYLRQLILSCRRHKIAYRLDDRRQKLAPVSFEFAGRLRPFQQIAVERMLARDFGTLNSATGSGKTVMALAMIARRRQPTLIVVHTKELAQQWIDRIGAFLGIASEACGLIGSGKHRLGEKITVSLVQSLYKRADQVAAHVGFLVVDECHRCPSRTFTEAVSSFDSQFMLGLSATPYRRDRLSQLIFWHLGDVHHEVDKAHLVETGAVLTAEVHVRETAFKPYHDPVTEYSKMLSELTADTDRNGLIAADVVAAAASGPGVCLVLSDRKAHCINLQSLLKYRFKLEAALLTGDLNASQRLTVVDRLNAGEVRVVIATGQLIGEGFDCPNLTTLFLATPVSFSGRVLQYVGRVLRPAPGKHHARIFDYVDVHVEPLVKAARARQRVYGPDVELNRGDSVDVPGKIDLLDSSNGAII